MNDRARLIITGVVAAIALAGTIGWHGLHIDFGDDDERDARDQDRHAMARTLDGLKDFDGVTVTGPDDVIVAHGAAFRVEAKGDKAVLDQLDLSVSDGMLHVGRKSGMSWGGHGDARIHVTLPALHRISLTGPADLRVDRLAGKAVTARTTGPGDIVIDALEAETAELVSTGPGDLKVSGRAKSASLSTTGPGDIIASKLDAERASLRIVGPGDISAHASQGADIFILGPGDARVAGTTICQISKTGPGDAQCKG